MGVRMAKIHQKYIFLNFLTVLDFWKISLKRGGDCVMTKYSCYHFILHKNSFSFLFFLSTTYFSFFSHGSSLFSLLSTTFFFSLLLALVSFFNFNSSSYTCFGLKDTRVMDLLFFTKKKVLIIELTLNYHGLPNSM